MGKTKIEYATDVWNPATGCTPVSEGCENCYARRMAYRLRGRCGYPEDDPFRVTVRPEKLDEPLCWKKPRRVFVCSMGDLFHDDVPDSFIAEVFGVIAVAADAFYGPRDGSICVGSYRIPQFRHGPHTFMLLTKRPKRARALILTESFRKEVARAAYRRAYNRRCADEVYCSIAGTDDFGRTSSKKHWPLPNLWIGVTAENQARADERIPILLQIPAAVRFVSCEPLLGPIALSRWLRYRCAGCGEWLEPGEVEDGGHARTAYDRHGYPYPELCGPVYSEGLNWVIVGGETGPGARPMHPDWVRSLKDQCQATGTPFFLKQMYVDGNLVRMPELDGRRWNELPCF